MEPKYLYCVADVKNKTVCLLLAVMFAFPAKTFELPHRPQGAVAVCTDCAVLAPGMATKGLEGLG